MPALREVFLLLKGFPMFAVLVSITMVANSLPRPYPQAMPGIIPEFRQEKPGEYGWYTRPGVKWSKWPERPTRYWHGVSGLLFCDDPHCSQCNENVYPPSVTDRINGTRPTVGIKR